MPIIAITPPDYPAPIGAYAYAAYARGTFSTSEPRLTPTAPHIVLVPICILKEMSLQIQFSILLYLQRILAPKGNKGNGFSITQKLLNTNFTEFPTLGSKLSSTILL